MTSKTMRRAGINPGLPAHVRAGLEDGCDCAASIQDVERVVVGAFSLLVCLRCEKLATKVRGAAS